MSVVTLNAKNYRRLREMNYYHDYPLFNLLNQIPHTKTVTCRLPLETGYALTADQRRSGKFPAYLLPFKDYYELVDEYRWAIYRLKPEYRYPAERPTYQFEVNYYTYEVVVGKEVRDAAREKVAQYKRLTKEWEAFLG